MKNVFHRPAIKRLAYVQPAEFKVGIPRQMLDVIHASGKQIIYRDYLVSFCQQGIAKMRPQEARSPCYQRAHIETPC